MNKKQAILVLTVVLFLFYLPIIISPEPYVAENLRKNNIVDTLVLSNGVVHYEEAGESDTAILLISGFTIPFFVWDRQFDTLASVGWRTVRYNFFSRGLSDYIETEYSSEHYRDQAIEILDSLDIENVILVGHSMGATIASEITLAIPDRVVGIALMDPMLDEVSENSGAKIARLPIVNRWLSRLIMGRAVQKRANELLTHCNVPQNSEYRDMFEVQRKTSGFHSSLFSGFQGTALENYKTGYRSLNELDIPVLIVSGDPQSEKENRHILQIVETLSNAEQITIPNACHLVQFDDPEAVNDALFKFIENGTIED